MQIFTLHRDPECEMYWQVDVGDPQALIHLGGHGSVADTWEAPEVLLWKKKEDDEAAAKPCDVPYGSGRALLLSDRGMQLLRPHLAEWGEFLKVHAEGRSLWVYNPFVRVDAFDEERSVYERLSTGMIWSVSRYEFNAEKLQGAPVFKTMSLRNELFVTQDFVQLAERFELRGTEFVPVWSDS